MKKKIILIGLIGIFILLLLGVYFYMNPNSNYISDNANYENTYESENNDSSKKNIISVGEESFEEEVLDSEKTVLIDFYADWCEPCKQLSPIIEDISKEIDDVKFVRIDVDANEELATKYQIMYMPTLIVIKEGKEIDRSVGLIDKVSILELINK